MRDLVKKLGVGAVKSGGRNNLGRTTVFHRGGGHKRRIRGVGFSNEFLGVPAIVKGFEYDPARKSRIMVLAFSTGHLGYVIETEGLKVGDCVVQLDRFEDYKANRFGFRKEGSRFPLKFFLVGEQVHSVELEPGSGSVVLRSAGTYGTIVKNDVEANVVLLKLRSGEVRLLSGDCYAVGGSVGNASARFIKLSKAGQSRWLGRRPVVRGVAMNPVDHPHGGRTCGGRPSVSPWGRLTKGQPTRRNKFSKRIVERNRRVR